MNKRTMWTEEKILEYMRNLIEKNNGEWVNCTKLKNDGEYRIHNAMVNHGGVNYFKEKLGFITSDMVESDREKTYESVLVELIEKLNEFPTEEYLIENGYRWMVRIIKSKNETLNYYREKYGFKEIKRNYWKNWDNLTKEISKLIIDGLFPSYSIVSKKLGAGACKGISYFGGIGAVSKKMGYNKVASGYISTDGHFLKSSYELLFDEFLYKNGICHDVNKKIHPDFKYTYDFKIGDNYIEIWGLSNKGRKIKNNDKNIIKNYEIKRQIKENIYKKLNLNLISIEAEVFRLPISEIEKEFENIVNKIDGLEFFKINSCNGNTKELYEVVNSFELWSEEKIQFKMGEICKQLGRFPVSKELPSSIRNVVRKKGMNYYAEKLGYKPNRPKPILYSYEVIFDMIYKIFIDCKEILKSVRKINENLYNTILRKGGLAVFSKSTQIQENPPKSIQVLGEL